jgi:hypothetical protein
MEQKRKFIKQFWSNARQSRIEGRILVMVWKMIQMLLEVKPSYQEALAAALTLSKYVADLNEPSVCKLEVILVQFGCQTQLGASNSC